MSFLTVPGSMWPGQRTTIGARMPPSQVVSLPPLNGVVPPSGIGDRLGAVVGGEDDDGVVELAHLLELLEHVADVVVHLLHAGFVDAPVLAAGLADHRHVFVDSTVVMCMRAGLYQTKNGLLVFFGSLRSRKSMTLAEISSSTVFERSSVSGPSSLQVWLAEVPSEDLHAEHRTRRRQARSSSWGRRAAGTSARPGIGVFLQGGATVCSVGVLLMSGKLTPCIASRW